MLRSRAALLAGLLTLTVAGPAAAAPPAGDQRAEAVEIPSLPNTQFGSTAEATLEPTEPPGSAVQITKSVWYRYVPVVSGRMVVTLFAGGNLDGAVEAFRSVRSQLTYLDGGPTGEDGQATIEFAVTAGEQILLRVGERFGSVSGTYRIFVSGTTDDVRGPGAALPRGGVDDTLDRALEPAAVWAVPLREGRTTRLNFSAPGESCALVLELFAPGTTTFTNARPLRTIPCDGYALVTPARGEGGTYVVRVSTRRGARGAQRYHLEAAGAGEDDTTPGVFLPNRTSVRGTLDARRVDRVDLYRFAIGRRSSLKLTLGGAGTKATMVLRNDKGRVIQTAADGELRRDIAPGRYYVTLTAAPGATTAYVVRRASRAITRTTVGVTARSKLGRVVTARVRVRPALGGPVRVTVQRLDPEFGWQYDRTLRATLRDGRAEMTFTPPSVGRWRVRAEYLGTADASPSESGYDALLVTG